jgi:hypothetical protein
VVQHSYKVGGLTFGIRTNSEAVGDWLHDCLGAYRTRKKADPYYSIHVAGQYGSSMRGYHILYRETLKLARTFDLTGVGRTLFAELESLLFPDRDDAVYLEASVVASDGAVALVPGTAALYVATLGDRKVQRAGLRLPVETKVAIDPDSGEAVPIESRLKIPADAIARLAALAPVDRSDDRLVLDGPVKLDAVFSIGPTEDPLLPVSSAVALYRLGSHALNLGKLGTAGLETLLGVVERARCYEVASGMPQEVLDAFSAGIRSR